MSKLTTAQKIFLNSMKCTTSMKSKSSPSKLIGCANQLMFLYGCLWVTMIIPQTPPVLKVTLGVASVVVMRKSGQYLDKAEMRNRNM